MEEHLTLLPHGLQRLRHRPEVHVQLLKMGLHWEQSTATCCCISSAAAVALPGGLFTSSGTVWFTNTPRQEDTDAPLLPPPPPPPGRPRCSYPMQRPLVPGDEPRPLTEQGPFHLLVHKLYGDDWHAQLMAFTVCHPAVPVVDAKFLKRVFSVDTLVKPHPPVIAYSVSHNINFFRIFIQFWDEEGIANTQMSLGLGNDDGSRQCADCGQTKFL